MPIRLPLLLAVLLLAGSAALDAAVVRFPGGRIAVSHDGNANDTDDYNSSAFHVALFARAGLASKVVHFDYNSCTRETDADREAIMRSGIQQACQRFGMDFGVCYDDQSQLSAAIANFKAEAEKSSATDPLWYVIGGPMDVPYRCISAVTPAKRQFIHCISHSSWNDTYGPRTWTQLGSLGATLHHISSQNNYPFRCATTEWHWLRDSADPHLAWLFQWIDPKMAVDVSDAGMGFWLITGGPDGGLDKEATMAHIRETLEGAAPPAVFSVSAGADRTVALSGGSATLTLDGTLSNVPAGTTASVTWSQVSGPAATIASPGSLDTTASVGATGTYVFQLAATAGTAADSDTVQFTVTTGTTTNLRPVVDAGPDATVTLVGGVATLALDATVTDDALPDGTLTTKWTRPSGPAAVTFAAATAIDTTVTFTVAGEYKLKLAANDGALIGTDTLLVMVLAGSTVVNQRPVVDVGPDVTVELVDGAATLALDATVTDDGLPSGILTCKWTRPSGPAAVVFADATVIDTDVTFTVPGIYKLKLAANDGALIGTDAVSVTVVDAAAPPAPTGSG